MEEKMMLREKEVYPDPQVIAEALGDTYPAFESLVAAVTSPDFGLELQWNYYNDGKAWLCKVCFRKKTVMWISVWERFFRTSFYFTDKTASGIYQLPIDGQIRESFSQASPVGKLIPLVLRVSREEQISDILRIIDYKKQLK